MNNGKLYFYCLDAAGYEEYYKVVFYSTHKYSQEEFEDIIFKAYEKYCEYLLVNEEYSKCFPNVYFSIDDAITDDVFIDFITAISDLYCTDDTYSCRVRFSINGGMTECDNRLSSIRDDLAVDVGCWDSCPVHDEEMKQGLSERLSSRRSCLVHDKIK